MKILFVCRGNVARSQIAEVLLRKAFGDKYEVTSAGTKLSGPEQPLGDLEAVMENVFQVMREEGIDISSQVRKQITPEMAQGVDKIILTIDEHDPVPDYLINNPKVIRWEVPDPKGQSLEFTRSVRNQINNLIQTTFR